jgi:hypothetical protein
MGSDGKFAMSDEQEQVDDTQRFGISVALDQDSYFRHECPVCSRQFKSKASTADLAHFITPTFHRLGKELGVSLGSDNALSAEKGILFCPYCGESSKASLMHTAQMIEYARRYIHREVVLPMLRSFSSDLERSFPKTRRQRKSFLSISMSFESGSITLPPQPISGPERPDMKKVYLLCCNKAIKVLDVWDNTIFCPYCNTEAMLH